MINAPHKLLHSDLTEQIIGAAFEVHSELGQGFLEKVYETALTLELARRSVPFTQQAGIKVRYKGSIVGHYVADVLVSDKVICEIKVASDISDQHQAQSINYLKATGVRVALILNFGRPSLQFRRLVR
jgi:GxxExxY protein